MARSTFSWLPTIYNTGRARDPIISGDGDGDAVDVLGDDLVDGL